MSKHYDVHLVEIMHVVVSDDELDPKWAAIRLATEEFWRLAERNPVEFATDDEDVYLIKPCDCESEEICQGSK